MSLILAAVAVFAIGLTGRTASAVRRVASVRPTVALSHPPKSWDLVFNPSFSGSKLDTALWSTCYWWMSNTNGCTNYGNDSEEKEWYLPAQVKVRNGVLSLTAKRQPTVGLNKKGQPEEYTCRSGMVTTFHAFSFKYGYMQINASIPFGQGLWPALWLMPANGQWPPEIDIMEHWGTLADARAYLHPKTGHYRGGAVNTPGLAKGYHTFTLSWTKSRLTWYYDGKQVLTMTQGVPQQAMYFIANVADYDTRPGSCSGSMRIKSIKVWQPKS